MAEQRKKGKLGEEEKATFSRRESERNEINYPYLESIGPTPREGVGHTQWQRVDQMPLNTVLTALLPILCSSRTPNNSVF